jgi:hypothetical protein
MLSEQELIGYLEKTLSAAERARVEAELERHPQFRRQLLQQTQLDAALRAALGSESANERVKQSVLAVLRGEREDALKSQILTDTADARLQPSVWEWLAGLVRRPALGLGLAAAFVLFVLWFMQRPAIPAGIELPARVELAGATTQPKLGETIRADGKTSATVKFADGTTLHLDPGTELSLQAVANLPRKGGKQLKLLAGSLSADVAKQPENLPLLIQTPHALVTVVGTEFDLNVATNQTALEVTRGLVKMTGRGETNPVSVAAGEFAVAAETRPLQSGRLARHPFLWPFSSASIWNRPLGSGAKFAPVPGKSFLADGPLQDAVRPRRPFLGSASDPLRRIWVNGEARADVRLADAGISLAGKADSVVLLQHARRYAFELRDVTVRADGDLEAGDIERVWLNGPGTFARSTQAVPFGLSSLGGLLREGELKTGIRHALSARVNRERLGGRRSFQQPSTTWPAIGGDAASAEFLNVGTLLAIPPDVDIAAKFGTNGPAYELARAMQDYGVYVTGFGDAPVFLLADSARIPDADAWLNQLVPLLQVVTNNTPQTPAGGGTPRRESAPALPDETE